MTDPHLGLTNGLCDNYAYRMKSGAFISLVAESYRVEPETVRLYARLLKSAGLLTTGARGVNAPDMTPLDAARMTIALLATDNPSKCVDRLKRFAALEYQSSRSKGEHPPVLGLKDGVTLECALERLFFG